ncbi:MAG: hypothetical protein PF630_06675 [Gammaproteobacteria bacterium]|jgi:hypothetical protein|nr:hypothetical protein [Gammaproteobacteria bacterium]
MNLPNHEDQSVTRRPNLSALWLSGMLGLLLATSASAQDAKDMASKAMDKMGTDKMAMGEMDMEKQMKMMQHLQSMAPYKGYIEAHRKEQKPMELLGGPIKVHVSQNSGGVFVALPDKRRLDPDVFGHPGMPRAFAGTPGINGLPEMGRDSENDAYTTMKEMSPFGDKFMVMAKGKMSLDAIDKTATDAATSEDSVKFMASWEDEAGNSYSVRCCAMLATHGMEFPTFGGVATNHILHGSSRIGSALMPTEFTYVAFWGMGEVLKNGETVDKPRLVHGMLTEYVRAEGYKLAFDSEVTPTRLQFHLMVAPFMPDMEKGGYQKKPVNTGFKLPNGMDLPFWHVMFETLEVTSARE